MRLDPELTEKSSGAPRPAPLALPMGSNADTTSSNVVDRDWKFPNRASVETDETDVKSPEPSRELQPSPGEVPTTPRGMSFFDVGGLLGETDSSRLHSRHHSIALPQHDYQTSLMASPGLRPHAASIAVPAAEPRRGSHTLLQDIGGLLSPSSRAVTPRPSDPRPEPSTQHSGLIEALQSTPPSTSPKASAPPPRQRRGSPGLQDVGGLLS